MAFEARPADGIEAGRGVAFPDTVSQPLASFQRPGRIYHADDFAPGARRHPEPRLVKCPSPGGPMKQEVTADATPTATRGSCMGAEANHQLPSHNGTTNGTAAQQLSQEREEELPISKAESKPVGRALRTRPPLPVLPPAKRQRMPETASQSSQSAAPPVEIPTNAIIPPLSAEQVSALQTASVLLPPADEPPVQGVWRRAEALARCLACDICCEILQDPVTCSTCMHCYCRDCIDAFLMPGGNSNCCPVCQCSNISTSLGQNPFKDHLKMDFVLESLVRKVFPNLKEDRAQMAARHMKRAALDAALAAQRAATQVAGQPASLPKRLRMDGVDVVELFVSGPADLELEQPYLRVHRCMPASTLARFLRDRLREAGYAAEKVLLVCDGAPVEADEQLGDVASKRWRACAASGQLLTIQYHLDEAAVQ